MHFNFGDAGNDERRADDDRELVGSGAAFGVDVGTADVGMGGWSEEEQETGEGKQETGDRSLEAARG